MKLKYPLACLTAALLSAVPTFAQTTIADWTFDVSQPKTAGPIAPEIGSGSATAVGLTSITDTAGNPGQSFSGPGWNMGDCWQFQISSVGFQGLAVSFDQEGSATGPGTFALQYSINGSTFTQFGATFSLGSVATKWISQAIDLSSITALNNTPTVFFRVVDASGTAINGSAVGSTGTSRIDNFTVTASGTVAVSGPPAIVTDVRSTNVAAGRTVTLSVSANGTDPLSYQWYYPNLSTPLSDGGIISGSTTSALTLAGVTASQAGNYQVIITNASGSITSSIAVLGIKTPVVTNIAYLRTLEDTVNWAPTDTNTLFTVQGTVTTVVNETSTGNAEFFIQDATGGLSVFVAGGTSVPDATTVVQVTGPLSQFDGLLELNLSASNPDDSITTISSDVLPTPQLLSFSSLPNTAFMEALEGSFVIVSNVFLGGTNTAFTASGSVTMTNLSGQTMTLFINARNTDIIGSSIPAFAASVQGVLSQFKTTAPFSSGYELDLTQASDLVVGTPPTQSASPIPLTIQTSANGVKLTWSDASFSLQSSTNISGPYSNIAAAAGLTTYTESPTNQANFYRLSHP